MKRVVPYLFLGLITVVFFYKTFLFGNIPFPGDLLISEYQPWKSFSYKGYNPGSYPNKAQYFDVIRQIYPWKTFAANEIKHGRLPLWNPHNFSGSPLLANIQTAVFYPTTILFIILPSIIAWSLSVILQPLLASIGMYLFIKQKKLSTPAALASGIMYGFSLFMTVFLQYNTMGHVLIWVPFGLLCIDRFIHNQRSIYLFLLALVTYLSLTAGHIQLSAGYIFFVLIYSSFLLFQHRVSFIPYGWKIFAGLFLGIALSGIQLVPAFELLLHSARTSHDSVDVMQRLLIQPKQIVMLVAPDIFGNPANRNYMLSDSYPGKAMYIGLLPIFFILLLFKSKLPKETLFFACFSIGLLLLLIRSPLTEFLYSIPIPLLSASAPTNFLFLLSFSLAVLAGYGFDLFLRQQKGHWHASVILICIAMILVLCSSTYSLVRSQAIFMLMLSVCFGFITLLRTIKNMPKWILYSVCILLITGDLFYFFQKFNPFVSADLVYPKVPLIETIKNTQDQNRIWGIGSATIEANFATQLSLYSPEGYDPLYPKWYGELLSASENGSISKTFTKTNRSDAVFKKDTDTLKNEHHSALRRLLGVRYIVVSNNDGLSEKELPPDIFTSVANDGPLTIYEDRLSSPRAFLVSDLTSSNSISETIHYASGTAAITFYSPNTIQINTESTQSAYAIITDTYYPGWKAFVNNSSTHILKAFHALKAIPVPSGTSTITLIYKPDSLIAGTIITLVSGVIVLIGISLSIKKRQ